MKFTFHVSPSIKNNLSTQRIMKELSLSLLVVFVAALIYYASAWELVLLYIVFFY